MHWRETGPQACFKFKSGFQSEESPNTIPWKKTEPGSPKQRCASTACLIHGDESLDRDAIGTEDSSMHQFLTKLCVCASVFNLHGIVTRLPMCERTDFSALCLLTPHFQLPCCLCAMSWSKQHNCLGGATCFSFDRCSCCWKQICPSTDSFETQQQTNILCPQL